VTARLGCDAATLHALRPRLVYCSVSGAGQSGPLAGHPTHDLSLQAMAGAVSGDVTRIGVPWVDLATGTSAALAITAAWHAGEGCHLDMSMLDAAVAWARVKPAGLEPGPEPTYGTLRTADGGRVVVALLEDGMWRRLCAALRWTDRADDPRLARYVDRRRHGAEIRARLERAVASFTLDDVVALAEKHDLPLGPADATTDPVAAEQIATRFPDGRGHSPLPSVLLDRLGPAPTLDP
jgi:crotonobetainyl-CoA:carnitine CoA-transferase CaiB-like acyl-CoA transferase